MVTPLNGKDIETKVIRLTGESRTEAPYTRYHLKLDMTAPETVRVAVTDMGFGELFPSSGRSWEQTIALS